MTLGSKSSLTSLSHTTLFPEILKIGFLSRSLRPWKHQRAACQGDNDLFYGLRRVYGYIRLILALHVWLAISPPRELRRGELEFHLPDHEVMLHSPWQQHPSGRSRDAPGQPQD